MLIERAFEKGCGSHEDTVPQPGSGRIAAFPHSRWTSSVTASHECKIVKRTGVQVIFVALLGTGSCLYDPSTGSEPELSFLAIAALTPYFTVAGAGGAIYQSTDNGKTWNTVHSSGSQLNGLAHGEGTYVAVGAGGQIWRSTNGGSSWIDEIVGGNDLLDVAYGNGVFVATGGSGTIWYSTDRGDSWTNVSPGGNNLQSVAYGGGVFITVGWGGEIWRSTDGSGWADVSPGGAGGFRGNVTYGNGRFVALAWSSESWSSVDGSSGSWSLAARPTQQGGLEAGIGFVSNRFVGIEWQGQMSYSATGTGSWTTLGATGDARNLAEGNGVVLGVGHGGYLISSSDGTSWTILSSGVLPDPTLGIVYVAQ